MNGWKHALIIALRRNSGYHAGRHRGQYALAFNVKLYGVDCHIDSTIKKLRESGDWPKGSADKVEGYIESGRLEWDSDRQYEWAVEGARSGLENNDTYRYVRPDISKKYGLDSDGPFDVDYTQTGRSGGYIALTWFEGKEMTISNDELIERLESNDGNYRYTGEWCQKLCAFIAECDLMFNSKVASAEVIYQMAYRLGSEVSDLIDEDEAAAVEAEKVRYWHERDVLTVAA